MRKNQSKQDFNDFLGVWRNLNFAKFVSWKCFCFFKILCRSSTKRHWIIKVDLKYWSYMAVKLQKTAFQFFLIFQNSKLLPITHGWQSAVHILVVSIIAPIKSPLRAQIGLRNFWSDIPPNHIFKHTCPKIELAFDLTKTFNYQTSQMEYRESTDLGIQSWDQQEKKVSGPFPRYWCNQAVLLFCETFCMFVHNGYNSALIWA